MTLFQTAGVTRQQLQSINMADLIPRDFINLLLSKIDLVDLVSGHLNLQKKSSHNYFARCPFHQEKSASFSISQPKQFYYCFGCGAHGNAIDFIMQHDRLTFPDAIEFLARQAALTVPHTSASAPQREVRYDLYDFLATVSNFYYEQMRKSTRAISYLKERQITGEIAQQFKIGYAPNQWQLLLDNFGPSSLGQKNLVDAGLIIKKTEGNFYDRFRDRIMFPIRDYRGRYIGFGGRIIDQGEPKYLNSPETSIFQKGHELYGLYETLQAHRQLKRVLIVEGYMDVIALFQAGINYAVATLGTATSAQHLQRLWRYTDEIIFCFDGDEAGRHAAWRALQIAIPLLQDHFQIKFIFLPDGQDPDTMVKLESKSVFEARLDTAEPLADFMFATLSVGIDLETSQGRAEFAAKSMNMIKQLPPILLQSVLIDELSQRTRLAPSTLQKSLSATPQVSPAKTQSPPTKLPLHKLMQSPIYSALEIVVQNPHLVKTVSLPNITCQLPGFDLLLQVLAEIQKDPTISTGLLIEKWRDTDNWQLLNTLACTVNRLPSESLGVELVGIFKQLTVISYQEQVERLLAKAAKIGLEEWEKIELSEWIAKKKNIFA